MKFKNYTKEELEKSNFKINAFYLTPKEISKISNLLNSDYLNFIRPDPNRLFNLLLNETNVKNVSKLEPEQLKKYNYSKAKDRYNLKAKAYTSLVDVVESSKNLQKYLSEELKIIDLGCGPSDILGRNLVNKNNYYALDLSEKMLLQGKKRWLVINSVLSDMANTPFANNIFDTAFLAYSIDRIKNPLSALVESQRITKEGGHVILINEFPLDANIVEKSIQNFTSLVNKNTQLALLGWNGATYICRDIHSYLTTAQCFVLVFKNNK